MKPKLIFVEGSQGSGKSTICRELREKLKYTTLLDLSAIGDKSKEAEEKMFQYHRHILEMFENTKYLGMNYVCCRSFLSERIYCNLGYKPYDFEKYRLILTKEIDYLNRFYDIYFILLTTNANDLEIRLKRDKFAYQAFSVENSLAQQEEYRKEFKCLAETLDETYILEIENDNIERVVNTIKEIILEGFVK